MSSCLCIYLCMYVFVRLIQSNPKTINKNSNSFIYNLLMVLGPRWKKHFEADPSPTQRTQEGATSFGDIPHLNDILESALAGAGGLSGSYPLVNSRKQKHIHIPLLGNSFESPRLKTAIVFFFRISYFLICRTSINHVITLLRKIRIDHP